MTNKPNMTCLISMDEFKDFVLLMDCGLDLESLIQIVFKRANQILGHLKSGIKLIDVFCKNQKKLFFKYLQIIGQKVNLKTASECVELIEKSTTKLFTDLLIKIIYPFFLMLFAFFMIVFFSDYILVQMQAYITNTSVFVWIRILKIIFEMALIAIVVYLMGLYVLLFHYSKSTFFLHHIKKTNFFKKISTLQFVVIFSCLEKAGLSTKEVLDCIRQFSFSVVKEIAENVLDYLGQGKSLEESMFLISQLDNEIKKMIQFALTSNKMHIFLELYIQKCQIELKKIVRKITLTIQIFSYISIGFLVMVVYQIMLMPMNMLNQF